MKIKNPIIPGFYPDPSICRVEDTFYLVTSTFHYFPGVPIFKSKDLLNWEQIGHVLDREEQLPLEACRDSGGIFAPTIRYGKGKFWMVTTNVSGGGHFFVHAEKAEGPWSNPIWVKELKGIDPDLFFDNDGKVYFTAAGGDAGGNIIWQAEIDLETGKLLEKPRPVWQGTGGQHTEAPHIYKINDMYYTMLAEGGTSYGHMITLARSESLKGPWEACPHNPILTHGGSGNLIQATGHGDWVEDQNGNWWLVCLAVRPDMGHPKVYHLGRETFLTPMKWNDEGWPVIGEEGQIHFEMDAPALIEGTIEKEGGTKTTEFDWNYIRNPQMKDYVIENDETITLTCQNKDLRDWVSPSWIGRRQQHFYCTFETQIDFEPKKCGDEAGITCVQNSKFFYALLKSKNSFGESVLKFIRKVGSMECIKEIKVNEGNLCLKVEVDREKFSFSYSQDENGYKHVGEAELRFLTTEVAQGFVGVYFGLYAKSKTFSGELNAEFSNINYKGSDVY